MAINETSLKRIESIANIMDSRFSILGFSFGLDGLIGLLPVAGDTVGGLVSVYLVVEAYRAGASSHLVSRMLINVLIDVFIGSIPVIGDIFDFFFKVNNRNLKMLKAHIG